MRKKADDQETAFEAELTSCQDVKPGPTLNQSASVCDHHKSRQVRTGKSMTAAVFRRWLGWMLTINMASIYPMLLLDSLPWIRRVHGDVLISLFRKEDRFMDWINSLHSAGLANPYSLALNRANPSYGPLTYLLLKPIAFAGSAASHALHTSAQQGLWLVGIISWSAIAILSIASTALIANAGLRSRYQLPLQACLWRYPIHRQCLPAILLFFPILFAFDRGNLELPLLPLICAYAFGVCQQLQRQDSAVMPSLANTSLLAVAVSIKPYLLAFAIFNPYFAAPRVTRLQLLQGLRWLFAVVAISLLLTTVSLAVLSGGQPDFSGLIRAQEGYVNIYTLGGAGDLWYLSPYTLFKKLLTSGHDAAVVIARFASPIPIGLGAFTKLYILVSGALSLTILAISVRLEASQQIRSIVILTAACLVILIFPGLSNEYKAVYLLIPLLMGLGLDGASAGSSGMAQRLLVLSLTIGMLVGLNRYSLLGDVRLVSALSALLLSGFSGLFILLGWPALRRRSHPAAPMA